MHTDARTTLASRSALAVLFAVLSLGATQASAAPRCINDRFADGHLALHFETAQSADHIVVKSLNAPEGTRIRISDGAHSVAVTLGDSTKDRTEAVLRAPLSGTDFTVSIDAVQSLSDEAVCLTDVALSLGDSHLVPAADASATQDADVVAHMVGTWHTTVCNAVHGSLTFGADGSWQLATDTGVRVGHWHMVAGQLQMRLADTDAFSDMHVMTQVVSDANDDAMAAPSASHTILVFNGALLPELHGAFTDAVLR